MAAPQGDRPVVADRREEPPGDDGADERAGRRVGRVVLVLSAIVVLPVVVAAARGLVTPWTPVSDQAIEVLRMHDTGTRHTPLVGPYSRFGWSHPGPLLFWAGAPVLRLLGTGGVLFAVGVGNAAALAGALAAARRLGGRLLLATVAAAAAAMVHQLGPARLVDPWNPHVTYLPLLCFLLAAPAAARGGARWPLPVAVLSGSFVVQSHVGTAAVVAGGAVGAAWWWWRARPPGAAWPRPWRTASLGLVLWSGPLLDLVVGEANLVDVGSYFLRGEDERHSLSTALETAARELGIRPAWAGGREVGPLMEVAPAPVWTLAASAAVLAVAWWAVRRRADPTPARLVAFSAWVTVLSVVAVTRVTGWLLAYVLRWTWPVGVLGAAVAAFAVATAATRRDPPSPSASPSTAAGPARGVALASIGVVSAFAAVALVASLATTVDAAHADLVPVSAHSRAARSLSAQVRGRVPPGRYVLAWRDPVLFVGVPQSLGIDLVRHGYDVVFPEQEAYAVGRHRTGHAPERPTLLVVGGDLRDGVDGTGWTRVARHLARTPAQDRRLREVRAEILAATDLPPEALAADRDEEVDRLVQAGATRPLALELGALERLGTSYDVWLVPPEVHN